MLSFFKELQVTSFLHYQLVKDGTFKVIERSQLESSLKEQNLSLNGAVSSSEVSKIGNVLGVNALITGSVTEFTVDSVHRGVLGVGVTTNTGKVGVNVRIFDASSGEILFASEGVGEESSSGVSIGSLYNSAEGNYENTLLGIATKKALGGIIEQLKKQATKLKDISVSGYIAYYDDAAKTYLLDIGSDNGLDNNTTLYALRVAREIKSPTTGEIIKRITNTVAELKVTGVDKSSATAICVTGNCKELKEKDIVSTGK